MPPVGIVPRPAFFGTFSGSGLYTLSGSQTMTFNQEVSAGSGGGGFGQLIVVPEPVTLGLLGIGSGLAVLAYRRARRGRRRAA